MQELTGRQKRHLRALGQRLTVMVSVGVEGDSDALVQQVGRLLAAHELIKVRLPAGTGTARRQLAAQLADKAEALCAGVVGRTALLYRPNEGLPIDKRVSFD